MTEKERTSAGEEPPPIGRSWNRLYAAVLVNLALLILLFYAFTKAFS
ncbi:MAG TPA: hypothetical protein VFE28_00155 [Candidatus Krumholzibacteria bacterium]|jgi:hypothetical protein|nr:hypothetical protein [Candidatus Krumholzibacteria bacterium]